MMRLMSGIGATLLRQMEPERAHNLAICALEKNLVPAAHVPDDPKLHVRYGSLNFRHPLGMAAGFDKNARAWPGLFSCGFSHVEVGTVTPYPQAGNSQPRLFRLNKDHAIINRMGFNNDGHEAVAQRIAEGQRNGVLGVNIGANKDSSDRMKDYVQGVQKFAGLADYLTINISSPNTPGLRDLQQKSALGDLLGRCLESRDASATDVGKHTPLFLKLAPDLDEKQEVEIFSVLQQSAIDGIIISNTTVARENLSHDHQTKEAGGLSGRPLFQASTALLARCRVALGPERFLVGVGGIGGPGDAISKIRAGANLIQAYSGFIFGLPNFSQDIVLGLRHVLSDGGYSHISELVGIDAQKWAEQR